jgi:hypothetical protein
VKDCAALANELPKTKEITTIKVVKLNTMTVAKGKKKDRKISIRITHTNSDTMKIRVDCTKDKYCFVAGSKFVIKSF